MATTTTIPDVPRDLKSATPSNEASSLDEKLSLKKDNEKHHDNAHFHDKKHMNEEVVAMDYQVGDVFEEHRAIDLDENGKERPIGQSTQSPQRVINGLTIPIESDADYALRLLSLDDDPSLRINTFRMWFLGLGLSCFGAVLGQIFVSTQACRIRELNS